MIRSIGNSAGGLDIVKNIALVALRDQFPAQYLPNICESHHLPDEPGKPTRSSARYMFAVKTFVVKMFDPSLV